MTTTAPPKTSTWISLILFRRPVDSDRKAPLLLTPPGAWALRNDGQAGRVRRRPAGSSRHPHGPCTGSPRTRWFQSSDGAVRAQAFHHFENMAQVASDLASRLTSRRWQEVEPALYEAFEHPDGDRFLAEFVVSAERGPEQLKAAALLGDLRGSEGTAALRRLIQATGPWSQDLRCASLLALAKRCGEDASAELTEALSDRNAAVKDYAIIGLAGAGDGRAWDLVLKRLHVLLRRPSRPIPSEVLMAVAYLVQHGMDDQDRLKALVDSLRTNWDRMNEDEVKWFSEFWPDVSPDGPPSSRVSTPDPKRVREWARDPLFRPRQVPPGSRDR